MGLTKTSKAALLFEFIHSMVCCRYWFAGVRLGKVSLSDFEQISIKEFVHAHSGASGRLFRKRQRMQALPPK